MNYKEYWWKTTKEALSTSIDYFKIIGMVLLAIGICALIIFLGMKYIEHSVPIFGEVISIVIIAMILFGCMGIGLLIFNYRHYKKYVMDGEKE